jgi:hypothetical protein
MEGIHINGSTRDKNKSGYKSKILSDPRTLKYNKKFQKFHLTVVFIVTTRDTKTSKFFDTTVNKKKNAPFHF